MIKKKEKVLKQKLIGKKFVACVIDSGQVLDDYTRRINAAAKGRKIVGVDNGRLILED